MYGAIDSTGFISGWNTTALAEYLEASEGFCLETVTAGDRGYPLQNNPPQLLVIRTDLSDIN